MRSQQPGAGAGAQQQNAIRGQSAPRLAQRQGKADAALVQRVEGEEQGEGVVGPGQTVQVRLGEMGGISCARAAWLNACGWRSMPVRRRPGSSGPSSPNRCPPPHPNSAAGPSGSAVWAIRVRVMARIPVLQPERPSLR